MFTTSNTDVATPPNPTGAPLDQPTPLDFEQLKHVAGGGPAGGWGPVDLGPSGGW